MVTEVVLHGAAMARRHMHTRSRHHDHSFGISRPPQGSTRLTDGFHLVVDALKANDVDTIYGIVGIPITDLARTLRRRESATSAFGRRPLPAMPPPPPGSSPGSPGSA